MTSPKEMLSIMWIVGLIACGVMWVNPEVILILGVVLLEVILILGAVALAGFGILATAMSLLVLSEMARRKLRNRS